jgi:hypothetical protein
MMLEHVCEEQPSHLLGRGTFLCENEMCHLVNRSTTTMIASNPFDGGKLAMKPMDKFSHGPSGIDNGRNKPVCFLLYVRFCWQIKQIFRYSFASSFKLGQ